MSDELADILEMLTEYPDCVPGDYALRAAALLKAQAAEIKVKDARIAELEAALYPFTTMRTMKFEGDDLYTTDLPGSWINRARDALEGK